MNLMISAAFFIFSLSALEVRSSIIDPRRILLEKRPDQTINLSNFIWQLLSYSKTKEIHLLAEQSEDVSSVSSYLWSAQSEMTITIQNESSFHWLDDGKESTSYHTRLTSVSIGSLQWIIKYIHQINRLFDKNILNIQLTKWMFIIKSERNNLQVVEDTRDLSQHLDSRIQILVGEFHQLSSSFTVYCMMAEVKGNKLRRCGFSSETNLTFSQPLWRKPTENFRGKQFRLACLSKPGVFQYSDPTKGLEFTRGYTAELMQMITKKLNFTTVLVPTTSFGTVTSDGNVTGMVGVLYYKLGDMAPLDFTPYYIRSSVVNVDNFISTDYQVILSRTPQIVLQPFILLQIFSIQIWLLIFAAMIVGGLILGTVLYMEQQIDSRLTISKPLFVGFNIVMRRFVNQGCSWLPKSLLGRILSLFISLTTMVIVSIYQGSVTAVLALQYRSLPIDSIDDLLQDKVVPAVRTGAIIEATFQSRRETSETARSVSEVMKSFSGAVMSSASFFDEIKKGNIAVLDTLSSVLGKAHKFEKAGEECNFYIGKTPINFEPDSFAYSKNSILEEPMKHLIRWIRSYGIIAGMKEKYMSNPCFQYATNFQTKPLQLSQTQSAFYMYGIGICLSCLVFVIEVVRNKFMGRPEFHNKSWKKKT